MLSYILAFIVVCALLTPCASAGVLMDDSGVLCKSAVLLEETTGTVLVSKNADERRFPGGLTKMMTALVAIENLDLDAVVTVSENAADFMGGNAGTIDLDPGEEIKVRDLLYCMMLCSSNEAAIALAETTAGSEAGFVEMMNRRASELGARSTHFVNPHGIHDEEQYTTAADMLKIAIAARSNSTFMDITSAKLYQVPATNTTGERHFYTDNYLLSKYKRTDYYYENAAGMSFGYTGASGYCLVSSARKDNDGLRLIAVLMGGERASNEEPLPTYKDAVDLFDTAFSTLSLRNVTVEGKELDEVKVELGRTKDFVTVGAASTMNVLMPIDAADDEIERVLNLEEKVVAPVKAGDKVGTLDIMYKGERYAHCDVVALYDIEQSGFLSFLETLHGFFKGTFIKIVAVIVVVFILFYVYITVATNMRRQRMMKRSSNRRLKK